MLARVKGKSKIIYIGINQKQRKDGLRARILSHFNQNSSASKYINGLREKFNLQFTFTIKDNVVDRHAWKQKELNKYFKKHLELPPANSSLPKVKIHN